MKSVIPHIFFLIVSLCVYAQKTYHVFPVDANTTPGTPDGNGSLEQPWDLQTALSQKPSVVNGGDTIYLHGGVYNGRFTSTLENTKPDKKITVTVFNEAKVILNGNLASNKNAVLEVRGKGVRFRNLEITFLGEFSRHQSNDGFKAVYGVNHLSGTDCEFMNLKIHNNPGVGFGSWKHTGNSKIIDCVIFNNGYIGKTRGHGVGIYVQNASDSIRLIKNNIIFNNYYKGVEIWSASKNATSSFVKNVQFSDNIVFNNGLPSGRFVDNLIVATDDRNGINIAKNIRIENNIFYHNTSIKEAQINGDAASLTIGYHPKAPVRDVTLKNNVVIGRNNSFRLSHAKSIKAVNNIFYCGYVHLGAVYNKRQDQWIFKENEYYTKRSAAFRFGKNDFHNLRSWQSHISDDKDSQWKHLKEFTSKTIIRINKHNGNDLKFKVAVLDKDEDLVQLDFSNYKQMSEGLSYRVKNIATNEIILQGDLNENKKLQIEIGTYNNTNPNFGVFIVEFDKEETAKARKTILGKFLKWLGF